MALHLGPVHTGENNLFSFDAFQGYLRKRKTHAVVHIQGHIQWSASNPRTSIPCSLYINIQSRRRKQLLNLLAEIRTVSNAIYQGAVFNATKIMKMGVMTSSLAFQASTQILTWNRIGPFLSTLGPGTRLVWFFPNRLCVDSGWLMCVDFCRQNANLISEEEAIVVC